MTQTKPKAVQTKPATVPFAKSVEASVADVDDMLQALPAPQRTRVQSVIARSRSRGRPTDMQLTLEDGSLSVTFSHTRTSVLISKLLLL